MHAGFRKGIAKAAAGGELGRVVGADCPPAWFKKGEIASPRKREDLEDTRIQGQPDIGLRTHQEVTKNGNHSRHVDAVSNVGRIPDDLRCRVSVARCRHVHKNGVGKSAGFG